MRLIIIGLPFFLTFNVWAQTKSVASYELWDINSLTSIGGHTVTVDGNPVITNDPEMGNCVKFDGNGDMLTVDAAPIGSATEFTVEVIFKPDGNSLNIANQPRFLCFWDPANASSGPRLTIELRVNNSYKWYFDGFLKTDIANLTLIDTSKTHSTGKWEHAAVVYRNNTFTTFVNGIQELSGALTYSTKVLNPAGKVSIGARFNKTNWYSGLIKTIKITQSALVPSEFITNTLPSGSPENLNQSGIHIYPVPATSYINIKCNHAKSGQSVNVTLYTLSGKKVQSGNYRWESRNFLNIDVSNVLNGLYLINLQNQELNYHKKLTFYISFYIQTYIQTDKSYMLHKIQM